MAEFINEGLDVRFTIPDTLTVRQQLQFKGRVWAGGALSEDAYVRYWLGAVGIIEEWTGTKKNGEGYKESTTLADPFEIDIDNETNPDVADVLFWAGNQVAKHVMSLGSIEKN